MKTTATHLRNHIFELLNHVRAGESITLELNGQEVGKIIPIQQGDWRKKIRVKPKLIVKEIDKAFAPLEDAWENHI